MSVVFDSMFCNHIPAEKLTGTWKYDNSFQGWDSLQLNNNGTASWNGKKYSNWRVNNTDLSLIENNVEDALLILNLKEDSLWFTRRWVKSVAIDPIKAIRSH